MSVSLCNFTNSNNIFSLSNQSFGSIGISNDLVDNFIWNNYLTRNSSNINTTFSFGTSNNRYNVIINQSNVVVAFNSSNLSSSNFQLNSNTSNDITLRYSYDTLNLFVNRSNVINVAFSNLDLDDDYNYQITAQNNSNGFVRIEKPYFNQFVVFANPTEFRNSIKVNGNIINSNLIQQSNNLNTLSNNLVNTSNQLTQRINWNSNNLVNTSNQLTQRINWNSNNMIQPWGIQSFYANSNNTFASNNFIQIRHGGIGDGSPNWLRFGVDGSALNGNAYLNTSWGGVATGTPLSFRINNDEAMRINTNRTIQINSNLSCCNITAINITTLSNQSSFSSNTSVWSSNNISSINFGSNNSVFSSNTAVFSSNAIITNSNHINSNLNVINSNLINNSNSFTNRINWNSNNLIRRNGDILDNVFTFCNNQPFGLTSTIILTSDKQQNLSAEYIDEAFIKVETNSNISRNVLSVVHNSNQLIRIKNDGGIIASNITTCNIIVSNNVSANEFIENGVSLSNKYLTLSSSNSSNFTLGTIAPINNIYITEENGGGGGFGSLLLAGLVSAGVSAIVGFGMNGIKVAAGGVERSLAEWGEWGVNKLQNGLSRTINDMQNRFLKGYTKMISDGGREWLNITGGPPTGLGAGIGPYTEKIALLGDSFKAGLFSVSIDGDSNTITITNFNSNTSNITSNVVICDNNSYFMSNVAIGKSNPTSMLDVNGTITASGLSVPIITTFSNNINTLSNQVYSFSNISSNVFNLSNLLNEFNWSNTKLINSNTPYILSGSAIQESNWVRLTDFLPNQTGTILYSNISQSNDLRLSFDIFGARPSNITNGADGVYVNFFSSNTAFQGTGYTVFFDNFNGGVGQNDALRILWNNSTIYESNLGTSNIWDNSNWNNINISLSNQTFNVNVNSNQRVFNFTDTTPRNKGDINNFYINGRTGGFCNIHRVKDIQFDTIKDWKWYNDINNNLIINNSNILNNRLNTASNSLVAVSNYLYNIIDPEATFASNIGVYSSNTIINTSNLLSNRLTGLSNIIINNSNAIHQQATFSSNLAAYSSNAINSLNSNSPVFSSNVAVYSSNNMISRIGENQFIVPNSSNTFADTFLQIKHGGLNDGSPNWLKLGVIGSAFNGIATIDTASGGIAAWTPLSFRINNLEAMRINTNRTITLNSNLTACNVSALNITGISNIAVWSSNNINAVNFGSNNASFSSNLAITNSNNLYPNANFSSNSINTLTNRINWNSNAVVWSSNNLMLRTGGNLLRFDNSVQNRKIVLYDDFNNDHQYYGMGINGGTLRFQVGDTINAFRFFSGINSSSSREAFIINGNGNINSYGNINVNNTNTNTSRIEIQARGEGASNTAELLFGTTFNNSSNNGLKGGLIFQGLNGWSRGNLHFCMEDTNASLANNNATLSNSRMVLTSSGILGIGTSNPTSLQGSLLHIRTSNNLANTLNLQNQGGAGARAGVSFQTNSSTWYFNNDGNNQVLYGGTGFIGMITNSNFQIMDQNAGNDVRFFVNASNANIGINVFNPTGQIHMNNRVMNRKIVMWDNSGGNDHEFYGLGISSFEQQYRVPDGAVHRFVSSTSSTSSKNLLTISSAGWSRFEGDLECSFFAVGGDATNRSIEVYDDLTRKTSTSTWQISSDERVKTNIKDADYDICYNNFKKIKLKSFSYNSNIKPFDKVKDKNTLGYIAQDVFKVFPKAVSIDESRFGFSNFMSLDTDIINKCMYGCIHKLIEKVEELEEEVKELKKNKKDNKW
jgi:hypothetical protein